VRSHLQLRPSMESTAPPGEFRPYISPEESLKEFTIRPSYSARSSIAFGAITVYVGCAPFLTVSASIPISVLSISILRRSTLHHPGKQHCANTGSAGESLAAGVMFTIPALIFLGFRLQFTFWRIFPLRSRWLARRSFHGAAAPPAHRERARQLAFLKARPARMCSSPVTRWFLRRTPSSGDSVCGGFYTFLMKTVLAWTEQPEARQVVPRRKLSLNITSEYPASATSSAARLRILFAGIISCW